MFQPQATPYATSFSSYGLGNSGGDFPGVFQPSLGGGGGVVHSGGPTVFRDPIFSPVVTSSLGAGSLSFSTTDNQLRRPPFDKMAEHDLRAQERAAEEYERDHRIEGPMVGDKKSSHAITEEYAKADPIYVAKTVALPQRYSHYRPIAGDGNCGWRAAGFSYYEYLLRSHSRIQLEEEIARITSLNNILTTAGGFDSWLIEDMIDETVVLLRDLAEIVEDSPANAAQVLKDRFNDSTSSLNIIYHLRLLASSWLAANAATYAGFIPDGLGVDGYRKNCLEPVNTEIEHLGMTLLIDVLFKPIGIAVEIVILDRSEGSQANSHIFQSEDSNGLPTNPGGPMIHLLYRPSHYDILYKEESPVPDQLVIAGMAQGSNIQVNRAHSLSQHQQIQNSRTSNMADYSQINLNPTLLDIPGYSLVQQPSSHAFPQHYQSTIEQTYPHSPMSASLSPISSSNSIATPSSTAMTPSYSTQLPHQQSLASPNTIRQNHSIPPYIGATTQLPIHTHTHMSSASPVTHRPSISSQHSVHSLPPEMASPVSNQSSFRPSKYEYTAAAEWHEPFVFKSSQFRNSHFNRAHYNNPDFHPEEWSPESEEAPVSRKKSS